MVYKVIDAGDIVCLSYENNKEIVEKYIELVDKYDVDKRFREVAGYQLMAASQYSPVGEQLLGAAIGDKVVLGKNVMQITSVYKEAELKEKRDKELYKYLCDSRDNQAISASEFFEMIVGAGLDYLLEGSKKVKKKTKSKGHN